VTIARRLGGAIADFVGPLMDVLLVSLAAATSPEDVLATMAQVLYACPEEVLLAYAPQMMVIFETAQAGRSPDQMKHSCVLVGDLFVHLGPRMLDCVPRTVDILCASIVSDCVLSSTVGWLVATLADVLKAFAGEPDLSRFPLDRAMPVLRHVATDLEWVARTDFEAATFIAESLLDAFAEIAVRFAGDGTDSVQIDAPLFLKTATTVWKTQLITPKTIVCFLKLMDSLRRTVGHRASADMHKRELEEFFTFCCNTIDPELASFAANVRALYNAM